MIPVALQAVPGIVEMSPGVRSCMIEYDQRVLPLAQLLSLLEATEKALPSVRALPTCPMDPHQCAIRHSSRTCIPPFPGLGLQRFVPAANMLIGCREGLDIETGWKRASAPLVKAVPV